MSFFAELKRRNVVRVGAAYVIIGWVIAQVAEFAFENFAAPPWVLKSVVVILLLGLPLVLFFAWAFEMTPEGIKREKDVDRNQSITAHTGRKLDYIIIACLVMVAALIIARPYMPGDSQQEVVTTENGTAGNSVAVLPFTDLSQEGDQEFFADGISEEILNVLVGIPDLKVAGRTSSFSFKGRNEDLREIGAALGVNHVLEGSVRRSGTKLRITAQLIRGEDGFHLWSETYDREIADIFEIQDEIARSVADQLAVSLGLSSKSLVPDRTEDLVAYENYLRARQLFLQRGKDNLDFALLLLNEATARDPDFAPAWGVIASIYTVYESYQPDQPTKEVYEQWRATGKAAAERAVRLNPDDGSAHASLGSLYALEQQWAKAFEYFDRALALSPDDPKVLDSFVQNIIEVGYFAEAQTASTRAVTLDPLVAMYRISLGRTYFHLGDVKKSNEEFEKAILIDPTLPFSYNNLRRNSLFAGEIDDAVSIVERAVATGAFTQDRLDNINMLKEAWGNEAALHALRGSIGRDVDIGVATHLRDDDYLISTLESIWDADYRPITRVLVDLDMSLIYGHPRWKEQVRRDGILGLWRTRGFPPQCRPLGADDFECD
jgi:TolB-like protein/Tfp pilus assembly protein PilF